MDEQKEGTTEAPQRTEVPHDAAAVKELFPLGASELRAEIAPKRAQKRYHLTHVFAPITAADWLEFERLSRVVMEGGDGETFTTDSLSAEATEWLWDERVQSVEGYTGLPEGEQGWKEKIPFTHKEAALTALSQVSAADVAEPDGGFAVDSDEETVTLEAARNGKVYEGLVHRFKPPSTTQQKEYSRRQGRSTSVKGTSGGKVKAILVSNTAELLKLYDELIVSFEGYDSSDPKQMDALHKKAAVEALLGNG